MTHNSRFGTILNLGSQIYVALLGILLVPVYLRILGHEAIGLIGFFALLQNTLALLDNGLTPTLTRETARFQVGVIKPDVFKGFLRSAETGLVMLLGVGCFLLLIASDFIADHWLNAQEIPPEALSNSIRIMILSGGFRVLSGFYRGILVGSNSFLSLSLINFIFGTSKYALVIPYLNFYGSSVVLFFNYQLAISILELISLSILVYVYPLRTILVSNLSFEKEYLRECCWFAIGSASLGIIWVISSQLDKIIISKILSLSEFGIYTLAMQACSAISLLSGPIINVVTANFTGIAARSGSKKLVHQYNRVTQYLVTIIAPITTIFVFFPDKILWVWTGNSSIAESGRYILSFYALGSTILAIRTLPWLLLSALGKLKRHIVGQICFIFVLAPGFYFSAKLQGSIGPALVWSGANLLYLLCWTPYEHSVAASGFHFKWLLSSVFLPFIAAFFFGLVCYTFKFNGASRLTDFLYLAIVSVLTTLVVIGFSQHSRRFTKEFLYKGKGLIIRH